VFFFFFIIKIILQGIALKFYISFILRYMNILSRFPLISIFLIFLTFSYEDITVTLPFSDTTLHVRSELISY